jgi:hypothetical protein
MSSSQRKKECVHNFVDTVLKKRKYNDGDKGTAGDSTASVPYVQTLQDLALEQSIWAETATNGSVLALCGRESAPDDLFDSFRRLLNFTSEESQPFYQELNKLIFPLFVHILIDLLTRSSLLQAEKFASRYCSEVPSEHTSEAAELKESLTSMHTLPKSVVDKYRSVLCHVPLSNVAFKHLLQFLQLENNTSIFVLIQKYINIEVFGTSTFAHGDIPMEPKKTSQVSFFLHGIIFRWFVLKIINHLCKVIDHIILRKRRKWPSLLTPQPNPLTPKRTPRKTLRRTPRRTLGEMGVEM